MQEKRKLEKLISYAIRRGRHVLPFIIVAAVLILMIARSRKSIGIIKKQVPEYEEYTYESILSSFRNDTVINLHPFRYIHRPNIICSTNSNIKGPEMIILVKSDVTNFSYRMGVRSTWGNFSINTLKIVFLLGYSSTIQTLVDTENEKFHDIIQEDFIDAYRNNTIKTVMAFNWAVRTCPGSKYLLFVDDDYFINVNSINEFLKENATSKYFIAGHKVDNARVFRYEESEWYMTKSQYPFLHYPPYISGGAMLFSMPAAMIVQNAFPYVRYISIDDVYVGIIAYLFNLQLTHDDRFSLTFVSNNLDDCLASHDYGSPDNLILEWKQFLRRHEDRIANIYRQQMQDILQIENN